MQCYRIKLNDGSWYAGDWNKFTHDVTQSKQYRTERGARQVISGYRNFAKQSLQWRDSNDDIVEEFITSNMVAALELAPAIFTVDQLDYNMIHNNSRDLLKLWTSAEIVTFNKE